MSPTTLMMTLPADEPLAAQVEQRLAPHAEVLRPPPQTLSLETIALIATIGASGAGMMAAGAATANSIAGLLKTLLEIKQMLQEQGHADTAQIGSPATGTRTFAEADEAFLRELLEVTR